MALPNGELLFRGLHYMYSTVLPALRKPREGWIRRGIPETEAESVKLHMYRLKESVINYLFLAKSSASNKKYAAADLLETAWMALNHDMPEFETPDFTPFDNVGKDEKHNMEYGAMMHARNNFPPDKFDEHIMGPWLEYEGKQTIESMLCTELDKHSVVPEALNKEGKYPKVKDMYDRARGKLSCPTLLEIHDFLMQREFLDEFDQHDLYNSALLINGDITTLRDLATGCLDAGTSDIYLATSYFLGKKTYSREVNRRIKISRENAFRTQLMNSVFQ